MSKRHSDDDLRWTISNYMVVLICGFDDEWRSLESLAQQGHELAVRIVDVSKVATIRVRSRVPLLRPIRNRLIAHQRNRNRDGVHLVDSIVTYAEIFLLAELCVYACAVAHSVGVAEHRIALSQINDMPAINIVGISGWVEFRSELNSIRESLIRQMPSLESTLGTPPDSQILAEFVSTPAPRAR